MAERTIGTARLSEVERRLTKWRRLHGGRGRPIPEELWAAAAGVAAVAGVKQTARALGVDRERLARRVVARSSGNVSVVVPAGGCGALSPAFVEVDAQRVFGRGKAVVRLRSRDGEQLEVEVEGGGVEAAAVARALWERSR